MENDGSHIKDITLILVCILFYAFVKGFCAAGVAFAANIIHYARIIGFTLLLIYLMKRHIKFFIKDAAGWCVFVLVTLLLIFGIYYAKSKIGEQSAASQELTFLSFGINLAETILGVFVGIWGVFVLLRPWLKIYPVLAMDEQDIGRILIKNYNLTDLFDVSITLEYCFMDDNGNLKTSKIDIQDSEIPILRNICYETENAHVWHTERPMGQMVVATDYIRCRIIATHSLSGIHFIKEREFHIDDCRKGYYDKNNKFIQK